MAAKAIPRFRKRAYGPSIWQRLWESRLAYLYIVPAGLVMLLITFLPLLFQVWMSLTNYGSRHLRTEGLVGLFAKMVASFSPTALAACKEGSSEVLCFLNLKNFGDILGNRLALSGFDFWNMLSFNLIWTFINVFFHVVMGVAFALLLNTKGLYFKRFYRALYIIPWALPALISGMVWRNMYDKDFGAVNLMTKLRVDWINATTEPVRLGLQQMAKGLGLSGPLGVLAKALGDLRSWLFYLIAFAVVGLVVALFALLRRYDPAAGVRSTVLIVVILLGVVALVLLNWRMPYSFYAVLVANIWLGWPFMMTVATGALQGIPEELYEAARIDGAGTWQAFWQVTAPLLRPAMVPAIMIGMMMTFNQFNVIYFVTGGNPLHRTEILVTQAFRLVNEQRLYGMAASFSIIVFFVLAVITLITNRISRATESYAA